MKTRIVLIIAAVLAVFGAVYAIKVSQGKKAMAAMASMAPQPPTVSVMASTQQNWATVLTAVASLHSQESIMVSSELVGTVKHIAFGSGAEVRQGDLLVELDTSTEQAQLDGLEAAAKLAQLSFQRAQDLRAKGNNSQSELDAAEATFNQAAAAVKQIRATIAKKRIVAPFSGRLGIRKVNTGEYLAAGTAIVELENSKLMYADFGLPQNDLSLVKPGLKVVLTVDAYPGREFSGTVEAINPLVSESTRNATIRAVFDNADGALKGGMFGNASLKLENSIAVVVVPSASIVYSSYGNFVYVAELSGKDTGKVTQQFVEIGDKRGDQIAITKGIKAGVQVVTSGQIKLRNGIPVRINNSALPENNPAPKPIES